MGQEYSNPRRESEPHALPDVEVFELTRAEQVEQDEELMWEAIKRFPLASMNSRERDKAIAWAIEESGATGGYFWWTCLPGCLPDGPAMGPFDTYAEALADARTSYEDTDADDDDDADAEDANVATHNIDIAYARACGGHCADCGASPDECFAKPCPHHVDEEVQS